MSTHYADETALVCDLAALSIEKRRRYAQVRRQLHELVEEIREVDSGYAFRYPADEPVLLLLAEFISLESRCCPFLDFALEVVARQGTASLTLRGPEGVQEFLRLELDIEDSLKPPSPVAGTPPGANFKGTEQSPTPVSNSDP